MSTVGLQGRFGRYHIERKLGQGGMGSVYLALDTQLQRWVALKVPHFGAGDGAATVQRFQREARIAAQIDHPNLCPVFDVGEIGGVHYFTMPYIEGWPLSSLLAERGAMPARLAADLVRKVALAVEELHRRGVVHRDLKPSNIMIRPSGEPVLMDFGLARSFAGSGQQVTSTGAPLGTPAYMSPEQLQGQRELGPTTDVWSLGVILYECLTRQVPFEGPVMTVFYKIVHTNPIPPSTLGPGVDPEIEAICLRALAKTPAARYQSVGELARALEAYVNRTTATPTGAPAATMPSPGPAHPTLRPPTMPDTITRPGSTIPSRPTTPARPFPWLLVGGGAALSMLVVVGLVIWLVRMPGKGAAGTPEIRITSPLNLTAPRGETQNIRLSVERIDYTGPVQVRSLTTSPGVRLEMSDLAESSQEITGRLVVEENARPGPRELTLELSYAGQTRAVTLTIEIPAVLRLRAGTKRTNQAGLTLVWAPPGTFFMGSPDNEEDRNIDEGPRHPVRLSKGFWVAATEITVGQFKQFCAEENYQTDPEKRGEAVTWRAASPNQSDDHPVRYISWNDAVAYCAWLSKREGKPYDLPTEAEWEYVCRAGSDTPYSFGQVEGLNGHGWHAGNSEAKFQPVGRKQANAWDLHDMHGNLWEWCKDGPRAYDASTQTDPVGAGNSRALRSGSFLADPTGCRSARRLFSAPTERFSDAGFRVILRSDELFP